MGDYQHIDYTVTAGRGEVVLDRPDVYNAFDPEMLTELNECLLDALDDDDVYVVLLTGRGEGFCAGADVSGMEDRDDRTSEFRYGAHLWKVQHVTKLLHFGSKPTVAAVNGPAVGAGCDFALACDLRVMAQSSFFRTQFVDIGLVPGDGGGWTLPRLVGESKAKEYLLTGRDIRPDDAEEIGLVVDAVDDAELLAVGRDLANEIRDKPATAVRHTKALVDAHRSFGEYAQDAQERQYDCVTDSEHEEAVRAFTEGREPEFDRPRN